MRINMHVFFSYVESLCTKLVTTLNLHLSHSLIAQHFSKLFKKVDKWKYLYAYYTVLDNKSRHNADNSNFCV